MPLSHPKDVTTQSIRVRRKVLKSFDFKAGCWYPYSSKLNWQRVEHVSWRRHGDEQIMLLGGWYNPAYARTEIVTTSKSVNSYNLHHAIR